MILARLAPLTALLLLAAPACAQHADAHADAHRGRREQTHIIRTDHGHRLEILARGDVRLTEDGRWVASVAPDARLVVEEGRNSVVRRAEFTRGPGGGVRVRYAVDGRERPLDAEGRAWAERLLRQAVENGMAAGQRVRDLRAQGGVERVLREIGSVRGDAVRRRYFTALLESGRMSDAEFARVMAEVPRRVEGDVERRIVLTAALPHADGTRLGALLRAAEGMRSDVEVRLVLAAAAERGLRSPAAREAYFRALRGVESDVERRLILQRFIHNGGLEDAATRGAFFAAVDEMESDVERRLVLTQVLADDASETEVLQVLASAARLRSDVERRLVLTRVPAPHFRSRTVVEAYRRVAEGIGSEPDRRIALRHLAGAR